MKTTTNKEKKMVQNLFSQETINSVKEYKESLTVNTEEKTENFWSDADIISVYTREQALEGQEALLIQIWQTLSSILMEYRLVQLFS